MIVLFLISGLASLNGVVIGFIDNNQSATFWAITSTIWCASTTIWYMCYKNNK